MFDSRSRGREHHQLRLNIYLQNFMLASIGGQQRLPPPRSRVFLALLRQLHGVGHGFTLMRRVLQARVDETLVLEGRRGRSRRRERADGKQNRVPHVSAGVRDVRRRVGVRHAAFAHGPSGIRMVGVPCDVTTRSNIITCD